MSETSGQPDHAPTEDIEDLYENAPCGYLSIGADGLIFKANTTLGVWTGFTEGELVGKRLQNMLSGGSRIFYETHIAPLLPGEASARSRVAD